MTVGAHHDVARLKVTMNDQLLVGELDRLCHFQHQAHALAKIQMLLLAVIEQLAAVDVLHRQPWRAIFTGATVDQARNVRMIQTCKRCAFTQEALGENRASHRRAQKLDRNDLLKAIDAFGAIDLAHAAAAKDRFQTERTDLLAKSTLRPRRRLHQILRNLWLFESSGAMPHGCGQ